MKFLEPIINLFKTFTNGQYRFNPNVIDASTEFNKYYQDREKLAAVLSNPALLKVISLQCDLFSLGEIYMKDKKGNYIESDPFLNWIKKPNPVQSKQQWLWDYMFWNMLGNSYLYLDSKIVESPNNYGYFLTPQKIDFPTSLNFEKDKLIFSDAKLKSIMETEILYRYDDGTNFKFPLKKLILSTDISNGIGNYYKGASKIDALYKIISNSEYGLDSKNINLRYSGKFMVGAERGTEKLGLTETEKDDIKNKMDSDDRKVYPLSAMANIQRFVEDFEALGLNESYLNDYFLIGNMYNIPRDVLEAYQSSTYENQEKARASHISYTLSPKGDEFTNQLQKHFGYNEKGLDICMSWEHLPFMQVFKNEQAKMNKQRAETIKILVDTGFSLEDAKKIVDL